MSDPNREPPDPAALVALKRLAQAATPGPYAPKRNDRTRVVSLADQDGTVICSTWTSSFAPPRPTATVNAAYFAALDPATTLRLIRAARREAGLRATVENLLGALRDAGIFSDSRLRDGPIADAGRAVVAAPGRHGGAGRRRRPVGGAVGSAGVRRSGVRQVGPAGRGIAAAARLPDLTGKAATREKT